MIAIGCDQAGFELKQRLIKHLEGRGLEYTDCGAFDTSSVDYPVYARLVVEKILGGECEKGILVCGTGIGMSMMANRFKGIRCAVCGDVYSARLTRLHNDANIVALGARVLGDGLAADIADAFLDTAYSGEERHTKRIKMFEE